MPAHIWIMWILLNVIGMPVHMNYCSHKSSYKVWFYSMKIFMHKFKQDVSTVYYCIPVCRLQGGETTMASTGHSLTMMTIAFILYMSGLNGWLDKPFLLLCFDETTIDHFGLKSKSYVWHKIKTVRHPENTIFMVKRGGGSTIKHFCQIMMCQVGRHSLRSAIL